MITAPATSWVRVSKRRPCPVCVRPDWCLLSRDGSAAICARTAEGAVRHIGEAGWLHRLGESRWTPPAVRSRTIEISKPADLSALAEQYSAAVPATGLQILANGLGVTTGSLVRLRTGHDGEAWTFPMVDATGRVIGIRRRLPSGRKLSVKGGHDGVFIPDDLGTPDPLLISEGPTDTAALLDLGFPAIGRPSCSGGTRHIIALVREAAPGTVVIVADPDEPGQRGADRLASAVRIYCRDVRIITPPAPHKDARAWKQAGATREKVEEAIQAAPARRLPVRCRRIGV